ncbi:MAG: SMI1/KNR4 family protein [Chloroflexota bacterium]|nr:MAG: SMI1/KNR4 family protein [Chloroflexota bacterium]
MPDHDAALDQLIVRLKTRAADPERRADVIVDAFSASARTMDLGSLLGMGRSVAGSLNQLLGEIRTTGMPSPQSRATADAVAAAMGTPANPTLAAPATPGDVDAVEAELGGRLPTALRRAYLEVADGGFGPGAGLLPLSAALAIYRDYRAESPGPRRSSWPAVLLPLTEREPGHYCVEVPGGRVLDWDPEDLREHSSEAAWQRSFSEVAATAEAWLTAWVGSRTQAEETADMLARSQVEEARRSRAAIAAMTPEQRAKMGLPEIGWERVVWGGIGLDEGEPGG